MKRMVCKERDVGPKGGDRQPAQERGRGGNPGTRPSGTGSGKGRGKGGGKSSGDKRTNWLERLDYHRRTSK